MMACVNEAPDAPLLTRFAALPAAGPLLRRLANVEGVFVVGGAVRDLLLGGMPLDLDLVVEGELAPVVALLGAPARIHDRFGTCTVEVDGFSYDLARARSERYERPGALPLVTQATIAEDLGRRDFTVNAIALGLGGRRRAELIATAGALSDLHGRWLRVLHDSSFVDDPTRLLRLARYSARLSFEPDRHTRALADAAVRGGALGTVSGSRVGAELRLLVAERDPVVALQRLRHLGLDRAIAPGFGLQDPGPARRGLALLPADRDRGALVLASASMGIAPERLAALLDSLAFPAARRDTIVAAANRAPEMARALAAASRPSEIARVAAGAPEELIALAGALTTHAGDPSPAARLWLTELSAVRLEIGGSDLIAAGVTRGPSIGAGLRAALAARLDGRVQGREQELAEALRAASDAASAQKPLHH
jgi:tRNA nucleotidyltransferase (CCA-adding enzyme)